MAVLAAAHHLIEQRFANVLPQLGSTSAWPTALLTRAEHQVITNAWRAEIPNGAGTRQAVREQIYDGARSIYSQYPEWLKALGL